MTPASLQSLLQRFAVDPAAFRAALVIPGARGPARLGEVMADFQRRDFAALDPAFVALAKGTKPPVGRYWWERTKGASKDTDLAVMLLWLLAFTQRPLACQVGAADADQADELRKAAKGILWCNEWLTTLVEIQAWSILSKRMEARCDIIAADVAGSHGARPDLLILNELSHVNKQEFAENLLDNAAKVPHGVVCVATNAGFNPSWQWEWRENARTSERWYFSAYQQPAPWLDPAEMEEARKRNSPQRFARLWRGEWVSGSGDALAADDLAAALTQTRPMDGTEPGWAFYGGLDIGHVHDASSLVVVGLHVGHDETADDPEPQALPDQMESMIDLGIIERPFQPRPVVRHPGNGRVRLARCLSWIPTVQAKLDLSLVKQAVVEAHRRFGLVRLLYDPSQAHYLAGECRKEAGVPMEECYFTGANHQGMAQTLMELMRRRELDLYRDDLLLADLRQLRILERAGGFRFEAPRTAQGHCDRAIALALATFASRKHPVFAPTVLDRPLFLHPRPEEMTFEPLPWWRR